MSHWKTSLHLHQYKDCLCSEMFCFLSKEPKGRVCLQSLVIESHLHSYGKLWIYKMKAHSTQTPAKECSNLGIHEIRFSCTGVNWKYLSLILNLIVAQGHAFKPEPYAFWVEFECPPLLPLKSKHMHAVVGIRILLKLPLTKALTSEAELVPRCCTVTEHGS